MFKSIKYSLVLVSLFSVFVFFSFSSYAGLCRPGFHCLKSNFRMLQENVNKSVNRFNTDIQLAEQEINREITNLQNQLEQCKRERNRAK